MTGSAGAAESGVLARRWARVMPALPDLITILDAEGFIDYVSPSSTQLLGLPPELLVGHRACEFIANDDQRNCGLWLRHAAVSDDMPPLVHRLRRRDGSYVPFESSVRKMNPDESGSKQWIAVSRDIAERTLVDQQLAAATQLWTDVYDVIREGVIVVDAADVIVSANRRAAALLGVTAEQLHGSHVHDHLTVLPGALPGATPGRASVVPPPDHPDEHVCTVRGAGGTPVRVTALAVPAGSGDGPAAARRTVLLLEEGPGPACAVGAGNVAVADALHELLSPREIEVLRLLTTGMDVRAVSTQLGISIHTTRNYVKSVLHKLDVRTQLQAVVLALRSGLLDLS